MLIIVESTTYPGTTERAHAPTLLRAFASVCETNPNAGLRLLIVGSGPMLPDLERLAGELGITKQSRFVPTTAAVADRLREIDVFVLPSLTEAFSNALMEAMACGYTSDRVARRWQSGTYHARRHGTAIHGRRRE